MSDPVQVVAVIDDSTGHEALYVDGERKKCDVTLYLCDIVMATAGMTVQLSQIAVDLPDGVEFPMALDSLMQYVMRPESN